MAIEIEILEYLHYHPLAKQAEIGDAITTAMSVAIHNLKVFPRKSDINTRLLF